MCFCNFYLPVTVTGIQIPVIAPILISASTEPPIVGGSMDAEYLNTGFCYLYRPL
jgi:hypothetical protein